MGETPRGSLLLVEDEHVLRRLVAQFLRGEGYGVVEAGDGAEGVDRFTDSGPFDLVLLDLNLPVFSGVEVCRRIKRSNPAQRLMICSAAILDDHETALHDLGVGHYLTKPYRPDDLIAHIDQEIGGSGRTREAVLVSLADPASPTARFRPGAGNASTRRVR